MASHVFLQLWKVVIHIFILWALQIHGTLRSRLTLFILGVSAQISRLTSLQMATAVLLLIMETVAFERSILHFLCLSYSKKGSCSCSFRLSHLEFFAVFCLSKASSMPLFHVIAQKQKPWCCEILLIMTGFPGRSSSYLPPIQKFLIYQDLTQK